jgi:hypothetical protein
MIGRVDQGRVALGPGHVHHTEVPPIRTDPNHPANVQPSVIDEAKTLPSYGSIKWIDVPLINIGHIVALLISL